MLSILDRCKSPFLFSVADGLIEHYEWREDLFAENRGDEWPEVIVQRCNNLVLDRFVLLISLFRNDPDPQNFLCYTVGRGMCFECSEGCLF